MRILYTVLAVICFAFASSAQIGYQVALLNQKTGEPRANETVSVTISITDNAGTTICAETKSATTNGAGILSLEVGNATTFDNTQWDKLPLWVSATVDGVTIGRTQILSVPLAEHANHYGKLTKQILTSKTWEAHDHKFIFSSNGYVKEYDYSYNISTGETHTYTYTYRYYIVGDNVLLKRTDIPEEGEIFLYVPEINELLWISAATFAK